MIRSQQMYLFELVFGKDYAYEVLDAMGRLEMVQFVDLNEASFKTDLHNIKMLKRTDELVAKLQKMKEWCQLAGTSMVFSPSHKNDLETFDREMRVVRNVPRTNYF